MEESTKKRWMPMVGAFVAVFGSFAALMYLSISTFSTGQSQSTPAFFRFQQTDATSVAGPPEALAGRAVETTQGPAGWSKRVLRLGREYQVGNILVTYRGKQGRSTFLLDVIIPELDSQYTYRRQINFETARKGFQVGEERLILLSAGNSRIRLKHFRSVQSPSP